MTTVTITEATIKTLQVEIKTLSVGRKQVTMGLFRQLQRERLIDAWTGKLRGIPWGRVNYFWGSCTNDHLHVVWQLGDELRRSCVYDDYRNDGGWYERGVDIDRLTLAWMASLALEGCWEEGFAMNHQPAPSLAYGRITRGKFALDGPLLHRVLHPEESFRRERSEYDPESGSTVHFYPAGDAAAEARAQDRWNRAVAESDERYTQRLRERTEQWRSVVQEWLDENECAGMSGAEIVAELNATVDSRRAFAAAWHESYLTCRNLDQLFIAV